MARVIRAGTAITKAGLVRARDEARSVLEAARAEAAAIRAHAEDEAARLGREASERGAREGRASVAALEARAATARARSIEDAERTVVGLVTRIAERVLHDSLADAPERVVPAVRAELLRVRRAKQVEVRVHPDDAAALEAALARGEVFEPSAIRITPDASLTRGGCVLTSDLGTLDARLEVQLDAFERALREGS
ncbi:MAG: type III secretion system stator protein SctL [Deltaproteobacteria bacterium]|nr:type III secretion system stator protein SctL [Deltaproteobacteria bacterium]